MGLASEIADGRGVPLPLGETAKAIYKEAIEIEPKMGTKDFSSIYAFLRAVSERREARKEW